MTPDVTYPPLDVPKPVADAVWIVDSGPQHVLGLSLPVRMTVLRMADGGLWLHSPTRHSPALAGMLSELGPVRHLVAPTTAHWTHLPGWQAAFPEATLWAAPGVARRARRRSAALRFHRELRSEAPADWDSEIDQALFSGPPFTEIAFLHRASRTLILADLVQNLETVKLPTLTRLFAQANGVTAPKGGTPAYLRLLLRRNRAANRAAAERLLAAAPERAIFAHGAWFERDATTRLGRAFAWLLR